MKFKIEINPYNGSWEVCIKSGLFGKWKCVRNITQAPHHFKTYDEVVAFVKERGIDKIYKFHKSIFHYYPVGHEEPVVQRNLPAIVEKKGNT